MCLPRISLQQIVAGPTAATGIPSESDMVRITEAQEKYKQQLRIPRRLVRSGE